MLGLGLKSRQYSTLVLLSSTSSSTSPNSMNLNRTVSDIIASNSNTQKTRLQRFQQSQEHSNTCSLRNIKTLDLCANTSETLHVMLMPHYCDFTVHDSGPTHVCKICSKRSPYSTTYICCVWFTCYLCSFSHSGRVRWRGHQSITPLQIWLSDNTSYWFWPLWHLR